MRQRGVTRPREGSPFVHGVAVDRMWLWIAFCACVLSVLALDLGVFHRRAHRVSLREAAAWTAVWVLLAVAFGVGVLHYGGRQAGLEFFAGYVIEKALSVDNIFVFVLIFSYFRVPAAYQHRVLFWGVLGALVMRGILIAAGAYLIARFHWVIYLFGAFLLVTGIRMAVERESHVAPDANPVIRLIRRWVPVTREYREHRLFVRAPRGSGMAGWMATPLFVVLVFVETTDLIFAVDSIPAVFAVTRDPFIVFTSNVFAILGLRSLYFLLADVIERFHFLKLGLALVLAFVGVKMLLADVRPIPIGVSLGVIVSVLAISVAASLALRGREAQRHRGHGTEAQKHEGAR